MANIIELEIKNLSKEDKEKLFKELSSESNRSRKIQLNPNYKTFEEFAGEEYIGDMDKAELKEKQKEYEHFLNEDKNKKYFFKGYFPINDPRVWAYNSVDEVLERYFAEYQDDFIAFQKKYKNSLYNQTIKEHNFKDLTYEDMVKNLTPEQKEKIVRDISSMVKQLKMGRIFKIKKDKNGNYSYEDPSLENEKIEDMGEEEK
ncbi:hypothetical protein [Mesomycoplasma ovipneumoniae]|uniref:hypothetical protein n=1 Tax=Mesomycoplasma ovipneumoniae TaxID=29562 RepID=UPI0005C5884B|nr:hypothetical protein [Mesomycoplasma ovipneumoniae]